MNQYWNSRNAWPKCLVVYRDGVSDGEYAQIEEHEVQQIEGASRLIDGSYLQLIPILSRQISGLEEIHRPQLQPAVHCRGETVSPRNSRHPDLYMRAMINSGLTCTNTNADRPVLITGTAHGSSQAISELVSPIPR